MNSGMEDGREEHTFIDEIIEDLSDLDEILHIARNKVKMVLEKKYKFAILLQKVQEMEKEKDRIQDLFEEGKIKHKLEKKNLLDQMEKVKEERDKFASIVKVSLIKKPEILSEQCDDVSIYDQGQMLVNDPEDDIVEKNNTSVSKSVTSDIEILTEPEMNSRILTSCVQEEFPCEYKAVSESSSSTETVLESCKHSVYGSTVSPTYIHTLHQSPTHTEPVLDSPTHSETVLEPPHIHSQSLLKSYAYLQAVLESPNDAETTFDISSHLQPEFESPSPIHSRASLNDPTRPQTILDAPKKLWLMLNENEMENVESEELVNKRIGHDVDMAGSGIIAVTEDSVFVESVTDVNLDETCNSENSSTVIVGESDVTEDTSQVGGGGRTDSRPSYTKYKREVADVKRKVNIVIPEKENYFIATIVDCPINFQVTDLKRKRLDVTEEVNYYKKIKSDVIVTFEGKKNETTVHEKKDEKSDNTVDMSMCRACNVIITNSKDAINKMRNELAERNN